MRSGRINISTLIRPNIEVGKRYLLTMRPIEEAPCSKCGHRFEDVYLPGEYSGPTVALVTALPELDISLCPICDNPMGSSEGWYAIVEPGGIRSGLVPYTVLQELPDEDYTQDDPRLGEEAI
jgi:hypothetical protein